jgi:hypothetical protein
VEATIVRNANSITAADESCRMGCGYFSRAVANDSAELDASVLQQANEEKLYSTSQRLSDGSFCHTAD